MHVHRRYSKRLRHHEESAAPPQAPLQTPRQEPLQAPLQAKEPDIEARRRYSKRLRNEESAAPLQEPPQVKELNIEDRHGSTEPKATQAKVDTSVMSISDIKRKTAEIKLQNATKAGELVDLKLEIQREKLKAARK
ncbi:hypothetical protein K440DRAFT_614922 [Wilcoxina mikolae CBS 423.85]|nr:hypothetical protein K440DRAFT_614922 [Wilcoxina mikolae CBS 423.85]